MSFISTQIIASIYFCNSPLLSSFSSGLFVTFVDAIFITSFYLFIRLIYFLITNYFLFFQSSNGLGQFIFFPNHLQSSFILIQDQQSSQGSYDGLKLSSLSQVCERTQSDSVVQQPIQLNKLLSVQTISPIYQCQLSPQFSFIFIQLFIFLYFSISNAQTDSYSNLTTSVYLIKFYDDHVPLSLLSVQVRNLFCFLFCWSRKSLVFKYFLIMLIYVWWCMIILFFFQLLMMLMLIIYYLPLVIETSLI